MAKKVLNQRFGGDWTSQKLKALGEYLRKFTLALKDKPTPANPFEKIYIDAFAGSGTISSKPKEMEKVSLPLGSFEGDGSRKEMEEGSARIALKTVPEFQKYIFIEKSPVNCKQLELLKIEFPKLANKIEIQQKEANQAIKALCEKDASFWRSRRAVLFIDPFGMQVKWTTIEAIAKTRAIDVWILIPFGIGPNRMLTKSGEISKKWREKLDEFFGSKDWYEKIYAKKKQGNLFGTDAQTMEKAKLETLASYIHDRLESIFPGKCSRPAVLCNSKGSPMYLLCFAASNERGAPIALRIANSLIKELG